MTISKATRSLAACFFAASVVALGLALSGCGSDTVDASSAKSEKATYSREVNQAGKGKRPVVTKSVKSLIAKDAAKD